MLLLEKPETDVFAPRRIVFERRDADAYQIEEHALTVVPFLDDERPVELAEPGNEQALTGTPAQLPSYEQTRPIPTPEAEAKPLPADARLVHFRRALLEVDDPADFWAGVVGGQVTAVEEAWPLTSRQVFTLFEDAVHDLEFSETWLAGYLLGLGDALLKQRRLYPPAYAARLKPLPRHSTRRKRR